MGRAAQPSSAAPRERTRMLEVVAEGSQKEREPISIRENAFKRLAQGEAPPRRVRNCGAERGDKETGSVRVNGAGASNLRSQRDISAERHGEA